MCVTVWLWLCCRALNNANWQWLSCSRFFHQYFRCYSPTAFGRKTDPDGHYIRRWLPALARLPARYLLEPWLAPESVQRECGCVLGRDYPLPMIPGGDHTGAAKANMQRMKLAYANHSSSSDDSTTGNSLHTAAAATSSSAEPVDCITDTAAVADAGGLHAHKRKKTPIGPGEKADIRKYMKK
jgi:cryptochrome